MRTLNWMVPATLLLSLSAVAQQPADSQPMSQPASLQTPAPDQAQPAAQPTQPATMDPLLISVNRDRWIEEWTQAVLR